MYVITENGRPILEYKTKKEASESLRILRSSIVEWWGLDANVDIIQLEYKRG